MSKRRLVITAVLAGHPSPRWPAPTGSPRAGSAGSWPATGTRARPRSSPGRGAPKTSPGATPRRPSSWCCGCASELTEAGPGRRRGHHRLAPDPPPPGHAVAGHDQPDPGPGRCGHPGPVEAAEVLLHPVRGRAAERVLAVRLHPLPADPTATAARHRLRDHHLARRPLPLRPARHRPPPGHRPDRAGHLPRSR